jgi:predicted kinase
MPNDSDETLERERDLLILEHKVHPRVQEAEQTLQSEFPTKELYQLSGQYTAERHRFHRTIMEAISKPRSRPSGEEQPIFRLVIGHPGAGKSTLIRQMPDADHFTIVTLERIMTFFPEYTRETVLTLYMEAQDLLRAIVIDLVQRRENFMLESLGYDEENLSRIVKEIKARGYRTELIFVDVPLLEAAKRVHASFLRGNGAYIPTPLILYGSLDESLGELAEKLSPPDA